MYDICVGQWTKEGFEDYGKRRTIDIDEFSLTHRRDTVINTYRALPQPKNNHSGEEKNVMAELEYFGGTRPSR